MKQYTIIDESGRAYMTGTDRKALNAMLACNAVRAHTARKRYAIRISCNLDAIRTKLQSKVDDSRMLSCDRRAAGEMLVKIDKEMQSGRLFYEMTAEDSAYKWRYYFFA